VVCSVLVAAEGRVGSFAVSFHRMAKWSGLQFDARVSEKRKGFYAVRSLEKCLRGESRVPGAGGIESG